MVRVCHAEGIGAKAAYPTTPAIASENSSKNPFHVLPPDGNRFPSSQSAAIPPRNLPSVLPLIGVLMPRYSESNARHQTDHHADRRLLGDVESMLPSVASAIASGTGSTGLRRRVAKLCIGSATNAPVLTEEGCPRSCIHMPQPLRISISWARPRSHVTIGRRTGMVNARTSC